MTSYNIAYKENDVKTTKLDDNSVGCAYTAYYPSHLPDSDAEFSLGKYYSVFSAELCAIRNALIDLEFR